MVVWCGCGFSELMDGKQTLAVCYNKTLFSLHYCSEKLASSNSDNIVLFVWSMTLRILHTATTEINM